MRPRRMFRRSAFRGVVPGLLCAVVAAGLASTSIARVLDDTLSDGCFPTRDYIQEQLGITPALAPVVVIGLDEEDFDALGKPQVFMSPELGQVVRHARASGATAVGIDMMIPHSLSDADPSFFPKNGRPTEMGKAVRDAGHVVLPISFPTGKPPRWPIEQWLLYKYRETPDLLARDVASIDLAEDPDRFIRRANVLAEGEQHEIYPAMPLALAAWVEDKPWRWDAATKTTWLGDDQVPIDKDVLLRINWSGPPGTFPKVNFRDVLRAAREGKPFDALKGKVVIIGATAKDVQDYHPTPYANGYAALFVSNDDESMAGPEIHAHALATILNRAFITTPWWLHPWPWMAAAGAALGWIYLRTGIAAGFVVFILHLVSWITFGSVLLAVGNWRLEMSGMMILGLMAYGMAFAVRWRTVRRMLAATKSQALAKALEEDPDRLDLQGVNRIVSVLFADVRGFSDFSSGHRDEPERIVAVLNAYFAAVIPGIEAEGGTVNLFIGDGMMVLFNAPLDDPDHALHAVRAARGMIRNVRANAATFEKLGFPGLRIGVGVNTGTCTLGAIGSSTRLDYTAIGDVVNAAARLESATKEAKVDVLIGWRTFFLLPEEERESLGCRHEARELELKGVGKIPAYPVDVD